MASLPPIDVPTGATGKGSFDAPSASEPDAARLEYLLRLGDDSLILGQRLSEWCGHGPVLEVDLSLANLSLDLIGQATHLLEEAGDGDKLAFGAPFIAKAAVEGEITSIGRNAKVTVIKYKQKRFGHMHEAIKHQPASS